MGLGELAAHVRLIDAEGDLVGWAHLPRPVAAGDLAALEQGFPFRVVEVIQFEGGEVDLMAEVEAAPICLA